MTLCMDTTINLANSSALTLLYKDNCNSAPNLDILTVFSALETLECFTFLDITISFAKHVKFSM